MAGLSVTSVPAPRGRWAPWYASPVAALLSIGAGYVHLAYTPDHWRDWWGYGAFFVSVGVLQLVYALLVLRWPRPLVALAGIAGNLAVVGLYAYTRTVGIPLGPHAHVKERAGTVDVATTAAEIVIIAVLLTLVGARSRRWAVNAVCLAGAALWVMRLAQ